MFEGIYLISKAQLPLSGSKGIDSISTCTPQHLQQVRTLHREHTAIGNEAQLLLKWEGQTCVMTGSRMTTPTFSMLGTILVSPKLL